MARYCGEIRSAKRRPELRPVRIGKARHGIFYRLWRALAAWVRSKVSSSRAGVRSGRHGAGIKLRAILQGGLLFWRDAKYFFVFFLGCGANQDNSMV